MRFFVVVTFINLFQVVIALAAEASNSGDLVDIGRGTISRRITASCANLPTAPSCFIF